MSQEGLVAVTTGRAKRVQAFIRYKIVFPKYNLVIGGTVRPLDPVQEGNQPFYGVVTAPLPH